jgi:hypothetical protein
MGHRFNLFGVARTKAATKQQYYFYCIFPSLRASVAIINLREEIPATPRFVFHAPKHSYNLVRVSGTKANAPMGHKSAALFLLHFSVPL